MGLCIQISLLGNDSVKTFPLQRRIFWRRRFLCSPCRIKGKQAIFLSRTSCVYCKISKERKVT
jgi:hypothetical protein